MANFEYTATPTLTNGTVAWQLCVTKPTDQAGCGNGTTQNPYPNVTVGKDTGAASFQVSIANDQTGLGIQFASSNPLWVAQGSKPNGPSTDSQIPVAPGGGGSQKLTFVDINTRPDKNNPQPVVLNYVLNFTDQHGNTVTAIDPDITNGGKTLGRPGPISSVALLIAVAVLLVIVVAVFMRMKAQK